MYDAINSRYTYKNSSVLKNKLNITTEEKLKEYETKMVALKLASIDKADFKRTYDEEHLKAIHKYLFEDVYDFAGQYRLENITKDNFIFSQYQYIDENIKEYVDKANLIAINDILIGFEKEYCGKRNKKGNLLIKEEYTRRLIK